MKKIIFILITIAGLVSYYLLSRFVSSGISEERGIAVLLISIALFALLCTYIPRKIAEKILIKKTEK